MQDALRTTLHRTTTTRCTGRGLGSAQSVSSRLPKSDPLGVRSDGGFVEWFIE